MEHIRQLHNRQLYKFSDLQPWLDNYELDLQEIRGLEAEHYHPMEKRYDLYGNLDLPGRGSLGPVLSQSQPATVELWNRIDDLDDTLRGRR